MNTQQNTIQNKQKTVHTITEEEQRDRHVDHTWVQSKPTGRRSKWLKFQP